MQGQIPEWVFKKLRTVLHMQDRLRRLQQRQSDCGNMPLEVYKLVVCHATRALRAVECVFSRLSRETVIGA
jgi:hypothetical protein